ncbi:hypothetical protein BS47DRAFT_1388229 [Hydnum rufescens UP504]|uniref:Protein kinase domain-containing protein n=1 Tax=Hydnum rufescens UP504 TaxID=1448309 RepID=A0A9P6E204_9AGAM|nr:hypothetical protein BS47DRAFT_1388229 [Hydnum rufescens UP504]
MSPVECGTSGIVGFPPPETSHGFRPLKKRGPNLLQEREFTDEGKASTTDTGFSLVDGGKSFMRPGAVVPKSYGFYVTECKASEKNYKPFLLEEECGTPIAPDYSYLSLRLPLADRVHIYSLIRRLHWAGFVQVSMSPRNILVQPGPLHAPHAERTMENPSYRIIDFGRECSRGRELGEKMPENFFRFQSDTRPVPR